MQSNAVLNKMGLLVIENFFDAETCAMLREPMLTGMSEPGTIYRNGKEELVDESFRKAKEIKVSKDVEKLVEKRLLDLMPELSAHFKMELQNMENPRFVLYTKGDFFLAHRDTSPAEDAVSRLVARRVTAVIFLNDEVEQPGQEMTYCGGALTFYGLVKEKGWEKVGFPVHGKEGLLVAFPADALHEVKEITYGERYTILSLFLG